jgi:hypothetical protein
MGGRATWVHPFRALHVNDSTQQALSKNGGVYITVGYNFGNRDECTRDIKSRP